MNNPIATYRLQFRKEFGFQDLEKLIPYFRQLGISTIYASPVFKSTPGSTHGYDGVNPNEIDPEIGSLSELQTISKTLKKSNISWLQDIVPNHMAFHSENPWLMDVLEKGTQSVYSKFFDIAWNSRLFQGKLMVPFLGSDLEDELGNGKVAIAYHLNRLVLNYEGATFPLNPRSYATLFDSEIIGQNQALLQVNSQIKEIEEVEGPVIFSQRWNELLLQLASLMKNEQEKSLVEERLAEVNADSEKLRQVIDQQIYVLCNWKKTDEQINFRRFFTVNGLICLNIQNEDVFSEYHTLIKTLVDEGVFQGLRIDHIDGLYDPTKYLEQIRELAGDETYVIVEKILGQDEEMPGQWPIEGTTGYEFLSMVNNLLTNNEAEKIFSDFYSELTGQSDPINKHLLQKKAHILFEHMGGELENLYQLFVELNLVEKEELEEIGKDEVKRTIGEFLIHCPVYRYYGNSLPFEEDESLSIKNIFSDVRNVHPALVNAVDLLEHAILFKPEKCDEEYGARALEFYQRCMQFTGPLMAKGGEDTLMYTYERFIGHNDVGDSPETFGLTSKEFHSKMKKRLKSWPLSLNTTSTHDTKRGEDVRARLNVLTDMPEEWIAQVREWQKMNALLREKFAAPDVNDEYLIYQTILGAYPMPDEDEDDFQSRLDEYLQKAMREAKRKTTWAEPNENYETGTQDFARELLRKETPFWKSFVAFQSKVAEYGTVNSLSQLVLKFTCPGIPDVYQGCELWDFSLVDPDNRREVDYEKRQQYLNEFQREGDRKVLLEKLWESRNNAKIKLWLTQQLFELRKQHSTLFSEGDYIPLQVKGTYKNNILAFARTYKESVLVIAVPMHIASLCKEQGKDLSGLDWRDTKIDLPKNLRPELEELLTNNKAEYQDKLLASDLFTRLPVAILKGIKADNERSAGILVHISSLASPFGIGDVGPESYAFADFLYRSNQRVWQLLPLNPTESAQGNSPYSALSSRAGNPSLISPELLANEGLLEDVNLADYYLPQTEKVDFEQAEQIKLELLAKAYATFTGDPVKYSTEDFDQFCADNSEWLEDFALYMVLREHQQGKPWTAWEEPMKNRNANALEDFGKNEKGKIQFVKWVQYIFDKQWKSLRAYCNEHNIKLLGDMPFYVSYNSADVWSHRDIFLLDEAGKMKGVAGVPPDAFSDDGQLWGMPVFDWDELKKQDYIWWIERLRKNVELFDLTRLDHFRAFADYWVVPGADKTAVNGEWKLGPGADFFRIIESALGGLPFVAEDLGEMSQAVYELRDAFKLAGMKVVQFAFDESMPQSDHIPHNFTRNFIAYTGTHDNNTVRGWFIKDIDDEVREKVQEYVGQLVNEGNIYSVIARLVFSSVANTAILPIQDVLNLDEKSKMNKPGSGDGNWAWRLLPGQISSDAEKELKLWTRIYNRE